MGGFDYFSWLEHFDSVLEWELRGRVSRAMEITGASRRQERLQARDEILQQIGDEHESGAADVGEDRDVVPHEHGTKVEYEHNGEGACPYRNCAYNSRQLHDACSGHGCAEDRGTGLIPVPGASTYAHVHHTPGNPYEEQSEPVHKFPDGWSVKKAKTYGDLVYEGRSMTNCIREDGEGGECGACEGGGNCQDCYGEGHYECGHCEGYGSENCYVCDGNGHTECPEECGVYANKPCGICEGKPLPEDHPYADKGNDNKCTNCYGSGTVNQYRSGHHECDECDGVGKTGPDLDEDCYKCDGEGTTECSTCRGEGNVRCDTCGGEGNLPCSNCDGGGSIECGTCEGGGTCQDCGGNGGGNGGLAHAYKKFDKYDAQGFSRAPGGPFSLRDPDNIPHVSFLHGPKDGQQGQDELDIHDIFGRENKPPKPEYQQRILGYMRSKLGDGGDCDACEGTGKNKSYTGSLACSFCDSTGKKMAKIGWGYGGGRQSWTADKLDAAIQGTVAKPKALLVARHNKNTNEIASFDNISAAYNFGSGQSMKYEPCGDCGATGHDVLRSCRSCDGTKTIKDYDTGADVPCNHCDKTGLANCNTCYGNGKKGSLVPNTEMYSLHALPTEAIGHERMEYAPADGTWAVKAGKGAKLDFDKGHALEWNDVRHMIVKNNEPGDHQHLNLPEYARDLAARFASKGPSNMPWCPRCAGWNRVSHSVGRDHYHDPFTDEAFSTEPAREVGLGDRTMTPGDVRALVGPENVIEKDDDWMKEDVQDDLSDKDQATEHMHEWHSNDAEEAGYAFDDGLYDEWHDREHRENPGLWHKHVTRID